MPGGIQIYISTGYDLWQKPFFRKFRHFLIYNISPKAETMARFAGVGKAKIAVDLSTDRAISKPIIEIRYEPKKGEAEYLSVP